MSYITKGKTFKVYIIVDTSSDPPTLVDKDEVTAEELKQNPSWKVEWAEFIRWDWGVMTEITKQARIFDEVTGTSSIDWLKLRELKFQYLLKDWSLEDNGKKLELKRSGNKLDRESEELIKSIDPRIVNAFLNKADRILEFGQKEQDFFIKSTPLTTVQPAEETVK